MLVVMLMVVVMVLYCFFTSAKTASFRKRNGLSRPLGLHQPLHRKPLEHGLLSLPSSSYTFDSYIKTLSRNQKKNLTTNIYKSFITHDILVKTVSGWRDMGSEHYWVVYDHQVRALGGNKYLALIVAYFRCWAFWVTCWGGFDEVYVKNEVLEKLERGEKITPPPQASLPQENLRSLFSQRTLPCSSPVPPSYTLVCFALPIIKGKTIRGMWFYQKSCASRLSLFHFFHQANMKRGFQLGLEWLDAGPSKPGQREGKEKLGYKFRRDYTECYDGDYVDCPPLHLLSSCSSSPSS